MILMKTVLVHVLFVVDAVLAHSVQDNICSKVSEVFIDSAIHSQIDPNIVYLFVNSTIYELNVNNTDSAVVESVTGLQHISEDIVPPIHYVYTTRVDPNFLELSNCAKGVVKDWVIHIPDMKLVAKLSAESHCYIPHGHHLDFIAASDAQGRSFYMDRVSLIEGIQVDSIMLMSRGSDLLELRKERRLDDALKLKLVNTKNGFGIRSSEMFNNIKGKTVSAAFIHGSDWFFFAGQHLCKVRLNDYSFSKCEPQMVADWIADCVGGELTSFGKTNTDISLYLIILVVIIAFGVIILIVVLLSIKREITNKKMGTDSSTSSSSST